MKFERNRGKKIMNYWGSPCIPHQTLDFMAFRLVILWSTDNRCARGLAISWGLRPRFPHVTWGWWELGGWRDGNMCSQQRGTWDVRCFVHEYLALPVQNTEGVWKSWEEWHKNCRSKFRKIEDWHLWRTGSSIIRMFFLPSLDIKVCGWLWNEVLTSIPSRLEGVHFLSR